MSFWDDNIDFIDEYDVPEQNVIDPPIINNSPTPLPNGGEQAAPQPSVESPTVDNSLAEKYRSAFAAAQRPEEHDALAEMFKAELNARQLALPNFGSTESGTLLTDNNALLKGLKNDSFSFNPKMTRSFTDKVEYNLGINLGPSSTANIDSVLTTWESDNGYYLQPDKFGIYRKFKNGIMDSDDAYKVSILDSAYEKAVHDAFTELKNNSASLAGSESGKQVDSNEAKISGGQGKTAQDKDATNATVVKARVLKDGTIIITYSDGKRIDILPDGTIELLKQGGGVEELSPHNIIVAGALFLFGMQVVTLEGGKYLINKAGEVVATWSSTVSGWVDSAGEFIGNEAGALYIWAKSRGELTRVPEKVIEENGGEEWTQEIKGKSGGKRADLFGDKDGNVYSIPKDKKYSGYPQWVDKVDRKR